MDNSIFQEWSHEWEKILKWNKIETLSYFVQCRLAEQIKPRAALPLSSNIWPNVICHYSITTGPEQSNKRSH